LKIRITVVTFLSLFIITTFSVGAYASVTDPLQQINDMFNLRNNGQYEECIEVADQVLSEDSMFIEAYRNKALAYYMMNKMEEALDVLTAELELNPQNENALYNAACISSLLGKKDQAIGYLKQLLALDINYKSTIKNDNDFNSIRETKEFQNLLGISVVVGGELLALDVNPLIIEGRTMVPMRSIFEALGANISWDNATNTVTAVKNETQISLTIDNKVATINGENRELEVAPVLSDNRTFVPVRFISEALNADVDWDSDNQAVKVLTKANIGTGENYAAIKKELDSLVVVSVIDGMWPEPYQLEGTEGMTLIIAKDQKALELMNSLDDSARAKYMYQTTYDNFALVVGCEPVYMKFVFDGKAYYAGEMCYENEGKDVILNYYENGAPINVVKQYKKELNYKDFYLLPENEQTTSKTGD